MKSSHRGRKSYEEKTSRPLLVKRSEGRCEVAIPDVCDGVPVYWSHRKRRSQSSKAEKWSVTNGLAGCRSCEQYLTDHGSDPSVRSHGWTVHPSVDPASHPVWRWGQYVWLAPDGSVEPLDMIEVAEWLVRGMSAEEQTEETVEMSERDALTLARLHGLTTGVQITPEQADDWLQRDAPPVPSDGGPEPRCGEDDGDRVPCNAVLDDGCCPDHGEVGPARSSGGDHA